MQCTRQLKATSQLLNTASQKRGRGNREIDFVPPVEDRRPLAVDVGASALHLHKYVSKHVYALWIVGYECAESASLRHPARYAPPGGSRFLGPACPDGLSFASVSGSAQNFSGVFCGPDSPLFPFLDGDFLVYPLLLCFGELHRDVLLLMVPYWMVCPFSLFGFVPCTITPSFEDPFIGIVTGICIGIVSALHLHKYVSKHVHCGLLGMSVQNLRG